MSLTAKRIEIDELVLTAMGAKKNESYQVKPIETGKRHNDALKYRLCMSLAIISRLDFFLFFSLYLLGITIQMVTNSS